ncbi:MAG: hypothetical protein JNL57_01830 [Bacteroidetes bacterium]|nr:hypothetical protein [Bacteroidota bacterium]
MLKKVAIFGLSMGSAATAMHLIYFFNRLYDQQSWAAVLPLLGNMVFSGLAVFLFIKSLVRDSETPPNMGKTLFGGLLTALLVALCTVGGLQYVLKNRPEIIQDFKTVTMANQKMLIEKNFPAAEQPAKMKEAEQILTKELDISSLSFSQIQMCLSTGVVVALVMFVRRMRRS